MVVQQKTKGLSQYIRTYWKHTAKAIKYGEPGNRLFAVVGYQPPDEEGNDEGLIAWKVTDLGNGMVIHPGYGRGPVKLINIDPFTTNPGPGGEEPSALFIPDSLYCLSV